MILPAKVLTGTLPFGNITGPEVVFKVVGGGKPSKPANALELGLSDRVWKLLEDCWHNDRKRRPPVKDVSSRVKVAASVCGTLCSVGDVAKPVEDPDSEFTKFGRSLPDPSSDAEFTGLRRWIVHWNTLR